jgi:hypothetical protein
LVYLLLLPRPAVDRLLPLLLPPPPRASLPRRSGVPSLSSRLSPPWLVLLPGYAPLLAMPRLPRLPALPLLLLEVDDEDLDAMASLLCVG